jgi:hypothetical protein
MQVILALLGWWRATRNATRVVDSKHRNHPERLVVVDDGSTGGLPTFKRRNAMTEWQNLDGSSYHLKLSSR